MNVIRLRYRVESVQRMREHLHVVDGVGYFFFPDRRALAPSGMLALLELDFSDSDESVVLRGLVWSRPATGGLWLELPAAALALDRVEERAHLRKNRRLGTEQLVLVQAEGEPALLCRLRDLSAGGARVAGALGAPGREVQVSTADGEALAMSGTVVWADRGACGVAWDLGDPATRGNVRKLLEAEDDEWTAARSEAHPPGCRCGKRTQPALLLLG